MCKTQDQLPLFFISSWRKLMKYPVTCWFSKRDNAYEKGAGIFLNQNIYIGIRTNTRIIRNFCYSNTWFTLYGGSKKPRPPRRYMYNSSVCSFPPLALDLCFAADTLCTDISSYDTCSWIVLLYRSPSTKKQDLLLIDSLYDLCSALLDTVLIGDFAIDLFFW